MSITFQDILDNFHQVCPGGHTERLKSIYDSIHYIHENNIDGDLVECGVASGYSAIMMALCLQALKITDRKIWLYDTYEECYIKPDFLCAEDISYKKTSIKPELQRSKEKDSRYFQTIEDIKRKFVKINYDLDLLVFIKGDVRETIPKYIPEKISLLRLDTDFYLSTKHEIENLYPKLTNKGCLIVDDYGHWLGAKKAIDDYFNYNFTYKKIDYTCVSHIKNG